MTNILLDLVTEKKQQLNENCNLIEEIEDAIDNEKKKTFLTLDRIAINFVVRRILHGRWLWMQSFFGKHRVSHSGIEIRKYINIIHCLRVLQNFVEVTNFCMAATCGAPCRINAQINRINGVTLPGRSHSVGDNKHGNNAQ